MTKSKLHQAALSYAAKGIPIFPCIPWAEDDPELAPHKRGKKPYGPFAPEGFKNSTTDAATIDLWWGQKPNLNIGASPHAAGCCVVDVDRPEAVAEIEMIYGPLPATLLIQTPRDGFHYWFKGEMGAGDADLFPSKVDVRGRGGYVLLPPSSVDGKEYRVITKLAPAPLPASIGEALTAKSSGAGMAAPDHEIDAPWAVQSGLELARSWVAGNDPSLVGNCDNTAIKHAYKLADRGLSPQGIYKVLQEGWNVRLVDPLSEDAMQRIAHSAISSGQNEPGVYSVEDPQKAFSKFIGLTFPDDAKSDLARSSKFKPLSEEDQDNLPPPSWLLTDLLPAEQLVMLYAPSKGWKTFLALDWCMSIAAGNPKWGAVEPGPVVYIAAEGAAGLGKIRRPVWRLLHGVDKAVKIPFSIINSMPHVFTGNDVADMIKQIKDAVGRPRLLVIDTLARFMAGMDESGAKDAGIAIEALEMIKRDLGCTVLVLHHTGKDAARGERGSSALRAGFDSGLEIVADKENMLAQVWARWHKDAETQAAPWNLKAQVHGDSFAFRMAVAEDIPVKDRLGAADVGDVLRRMKVFTAEHAVPMEVIVSALVTLKSWEEKKARALFKVLVKKEKLAAYEVKPGGPYFLSGEPEPEAEF